MKNKLGCLTVVLFLLASIVAKGQFWDCSTGLIQAPSAEMNRDGTFMITNNFLKYHSLAPRWQYNTFGYGVNISFWERIEFGYVCTIFDDKRLPNPNETDLIQFNQDRHFTAKILLLKEGSFGLKWMPAIAIGISDPVTGFGSGEYICSDVSGYEGVTDSLIVII